MVLRLTALHSFLSLLLISFTLSESAAPAHFITWRNCRMLLSGPPNQIIVPPQLYQRNVESLNATLNRAWSMPAGSPKRSQLFAKVIQEFLEMTEVKSKLVEGSAEVGRTSSGARLTRDVTRVELLSGNPKWNQQDWLNAADLPFLTKLTGVLASDNELPTVVTFDADQNSLGGLSFAPHDVFHLSKGVFALNIKHFLDLSSKPDHRFAHE